MIATRTKVLLLTCIIFSACSTTRTVPDGDALYTGANITLNSSDLTVREKKVFTEDLEGLARPKPNSKFLGIPFKLMIWNMFRAKKENSFFGKMRRNLGEPPVLLSQVDLTHNVRVMQNHLENKGFFTAHVDGDTIVRGKKAHAKYNADAGAQYKITSVEFVNDSSQLTQQIASISNKSLLQVGKPYDLDVIKGERTRIDAYLKENGFFYFSPDYLIVQVDSSVGDHKVKMKVKVKPEVPVAGREVYFINDIYVYADYSLNTAQQDTVKSHEEFYNGYHIIDPNKKYRPVLFDQMLKFKPGDVYNRTDHNKTLNRLTNLNVFKFVKNRFERANVDSPKLNAYYYLTPFPAKSIRAEIGVDNKSNNFNGTTLTFGYHHRNFFRAGEQFDLKLYGGTETSFGGAFQNHNTFRYGAEMDLALPRLIAPIIDFKNRSPYVPHTNFQLAYEFLNRIGLYNLITARAAVGYTWKQSAQSSHELFPISISYAVPGSITKDFVTDIQNDFSQTLKHIIDTTVILGSTYQYTFNQQAAGIQKISTYYFNGLIDMSGNLGGLFFSKSNNNQKRIFNVPFAQYFKFEADGRWYHKLGLYMTWANRIDFGYGAPYGNSTQLPYIKQFFTGGNSSIRAFRSRTVGPGTYHALPTPGGYIPDQTGDIKFEANTELRPRISGPLYGAIFVDAGNIWLAKADPNKPGSEFSGKFLSQLAVGTGVGLRLDIQIFVIRFDIGIPVRKPWLSNPWVLNQIRLGNANWRQENIIYNLAIGYPF